MVTDDRTKVTPYEEQMFRAYARSLSTTQLICLISVSKYELGTREGNIPQDRRGILKPSARDRLSRESFFDLDGVQSEEQPVVDGPVVSKEEVVDEQDPLGMGFV